MSGYTADGLRPRPGPAPRLIEGPKVGERSLYHQQVLDEDTYTEALSKIITRDFFPNLPHLNATNDYLTALTSNDPELLSSSIRALARISQDKEDRRLGVDPSQRERERERDEADAEAARRRELDMAGTPYISLRARTPLGARGWDTPLVRGPRRAAEAEDVIGATAGRGAEPSRPAKRKRVVHDDLSLDAFQRNYTSEDNASFVRIVDTENRKRQAERYAWAWEAERRANDRRLQGEERRKMILDAATAGAWRVDGDGRRLIGGLGEGGTDKAEGEAWKERRMITAGEGAAGTTAVSGLGTSLPAKAIAERQAAGSASNVALVPHASSSSSAALITRVDAASSASAVLPHALEEHELPAEHPLSKALVQAGLPPTALISTADGSIVPHREATQGAGDGRGRGEEERALREKIEREVLGDDYSGREHLALGGSGTDQWPYKMMNNLMFPPDAYTKPYPSRSRPAANLEHSRQAPPAISHANTRMPDEDGESVSSSRSSRRGSSPARSWVDAAVRGTPYRPSGATQSYGLVAADPSPAPEELPSLLTWGTLLATPRALDDSGDPLDAGSAFSGPSFRLPEPKRRDEIGRNLGNRASKAISERAKAYTPRPVPATPSLTDALRAAAERTRGADRSVRGAPMAPPGATPRREDGLTPAARNLLERSLGRTPGGLGGLGGLGKLGASAAVRSAAMEKGAGWGRGSGRGAMSWTPSPHARR
ncbi:hypothetical protein Q5752_002268 [Cryptotrichosporon argae]